MREIQREVLGRTITIRYWKLDTGVHVSIFGGDLAHIGAVTIVDTAGNYETIQFPTHKEKVVSEDFAKSLIEAGLFPAVVEAGVHYDGISRADIETIVKEISLMKSKVIESI